MITTLTLSPAFDVHVMIKQFCMGRENLAESVSRDVGGKGINISRALQENGVANRPVVILGQENAGEFCQGLKEVGLSCEKILCPGRIRENITVHPKTGEETRLSFRGFHCEASILQEVEAWIDPQDIVTFTGSLPGGISPEEAEAFLLRQKEAGARLVIDSKSVTLDMLLRIRPWLIKPNAEEIGAYFEGEMTEARLYEIASELHQAGIAHVMISLGSDGAILAANGQLYRARAPKIQVQSTIGAGDSAIAGFIAASVSSVSEGFENADCCKGGDIFSLDQQKFEQQKSGCQESKQDLAVKCLRTAVAYGSAACLREGTNPPLPSDIARIYRQVVIEQVNEK